MFDGIILSPEQLGKLNEQERKAYEQAYSEYLERKRFVDRIEELEKVKMPTVSVKKKRIRKINTPSFRLSHADSFHVNLSAASTEILNVTNRIWKTVQSNSQSRRIPEYQATLPQLKQITPNQVTIGKCDAHKIEHIANVPIASPKQITYAGTEFQIDLKTQSGYLKPNTEKMELPVYAISPLKSIPIAAPGRIEVPMKETGIVELPKVAVQIPAPKRATIEAMPKAELPKVTVPGIAVIGVIPPKKELIECKKIIREAPAVAYTEPKKVAVSLTAVTVPHPEKVPQVVPNVKMKPVAPKEIATPKVSVDMCHVTVVPLSKVAIPNAVSGITISKSIDKKAVSVPRYSFPNPVRFERKEYKVKRTRIPSIVAPTVDAEQATQTILARIG